MPRQPKPPGKAIAIPDLKVPQELLDQLVKGPMIQEELESMFRRPSSSVRWVPR